MLGETEALDDVDDKLAMPVVFAFQSDRAAAALPSSEAPVAAVPLAPKIRGDRPRQRHAVQITWQE